MLFMRRGIRLYVLTSFPFLEESSLDFVLLVMN
jgi:hypothetical protein